MKETSVAQENAGSSLTDWVRRARREHTTFVVCEATTPEIAREHARIWAELESTGQMTGYYDLIVAATARLRGIKVATFNRRHFEHIQGLSLTVL